MHTLEQKIKEYNDAKKVKTPAAILTLMENATTQLQSSGLEQAALMTGQQIPDFSLPDQHGTVRALSTYLEQGPIVLNIYRGGWCPYCNLEMQALSKALPYFQSRGVTLIGLTPETPSTAQDTITANGLEITVLSDAGNLVSQQLGLVFVLPEELRSVYASFGIDIPSSNGDNSFTLPVPATYIIGKDRTILYHFINVDYTKRVEPALLLNKLDDLADEGLI
ncbi:peroxiredoxin-like family protein [Plesiomonas shigelloides]|uniref:peroxiredoxin-like family protein n=1 Tax=Plesiomonas shigelloides TaxID=703 RepID=UPI000579E4A8|nr:peroxiredoxin-like family protein [Plesiomonas shigelloides]